MLRTVGGRSATGRGVVWGYCLVDAVKGYCGQSSGGSHSGIGPSVRSKRAVVRMYVKRAAMRFGVVRSLPRVRWSRVREHERARVLRSVVYAVHWNRKCSVVSKAVVLIESTGPGLEAFGGPQEVQSLESGCWIVRTSTLTAQWFEEEKVRLHLNKEIERVAGTSVRLPDPSELAFEVN
ncbi:hypothetical protein BDQ17DRAFT_1460551 [Cyathus striatus]|nr:hypothetical protein BDQ17DRAFT_1460551 [Cyathus striatus]